MNIASMKEKIIFQRLHSEKDDRGNPAENWEDIYTCHAYANIPTGSEVFTKHEYSTTSSGYEGSEFYSGRQLLLESKVKFTVRYTKRLKDIDTYLYRLIWNGREYNILSVDNVQFKNNLMTITAICKDGNMSIQQTEEGEGSGRQQQSDSL
jgi:head-tail adaptor